MNKLTKNSFSRIRWTHDNVIKLKKIYPCTSSNECSKIFNVTPAAIRSKASELKIKKVYQEPIDLSQFYSITKPEIAYFLGFLYADGSIKNTQNSISLHIAKEDAENVKNTIFSTGKVHYYDVKKTNAKWKDRKIFLIISRGLWKFLYDNDFYEKSHRSADKILSLIPKYLQHYFFRGFFDGDGCINLKTTRPKSACVSFIGSYGQDWNFILKMLNSLKITCSLHRNVSPVGHKKSTIYFNQKLYVLKFLNFIYKNRNDDKIGLDRKYNKFLEFKLRNNF